MIFTWEDGYTKEIKFGSIIRGIHHKNERPIKCEISKNEMKGVFNIPQVEQYFYTLKSSIKGDVCFEDNTRTDSWVLRHNPKREV